MPGAKFESCDLSANMARQIVSHERYAHMFNGVDTDRIAFIHAIGKKKPNSLPSPMQIKGLAPLVRAIVNSTVFVLVIYDDWYTWNEGKQFAAILEQLLLIKNDGDITFEDGKVTKYDVLAHSYMVMNFGLDWTTQPSIRHPIDGDGPPPGRPTFSGSRGRANARTDNAVTEIVEPDETSFGDIDEALSDIPDDVKDEIENES